VWILQKHRSRHFTFQIFKQKLKLKSIYMLWESCSSSHTEDNKISFAFFGFFCDFIYSLQVTAKAHQRGKNLLALRSLELFNFTTLPSTLAARPSNPKNSHRGNLGGGEARWRWGVAGLDQQATPDCDLPYHWPTDRGGLAGGVVSEQRRQSRGSAAAEDRIPVEIGVGLVNVLHGELYCGLGKMLER
jgi:hypothetical protein